MMAFHVCVDTPIRKFEGAAMNHFRVPGARAVFCIVLVALGLGACGKSPEPAQDQAADSAARLAVAKVKVPVTTSSEQARALFLEGRTLADDLHFLEAREKFLAAVAEDPEFAMAHLMLANTAQTAAQFFSAVGSAEDYMSRASEGEQLFIRALIATAENDQAAQLAALNSVQAAYPDDERTHMALGNFFTGQQDFPQAVLHYEHATEIDPEFASAFNSLGYAHRSNGDLEAAKFAFKRYVELIPDAANPYDSYAELLMEMGQYEESIANYRKALEIDPNFQTAYAGISINESLRGNAERAQQAAAEMLAMARTPGEKQNAVFRSITAHLLAGDVDLAVEASGELLAIAEADGDHAAMGGALDYTGDIMLKMGDGKKAREYYANALEHRRMADINDANKQQAERTYLFKAAMAAMVDGDPAAATELTAKYVAAAEAGGTAFERRRIHELRGFHAMFNEDNATAAAEFAKANQLNPIVLYWSGVINRDLGNLELARELAERAAHRNTLSANLPFFRNEAMELQDELATL
jgi:tetratricopeptide (TPR) repeat protein